MEAEPFCGVAMPLDVQAVWTDPVETSASDRNEQARLNAERTFPLLFALGLK